MGPRYLLLLVALLIGLFAPGSAWAQCDASFNESSFGDTLSVTEAALSRGDLAESKRQLKPVGSNMLCLTNPIDPRQLGRFARLMSMIAFFQQDEVTATQWGLLQLQVDPELPWPDDVGEGHPYREMLDFLDAPVTGGPDNASLAPPPKGAIFLDGKLILEPKATAEMPHLVQIYDNKGNHTQSLWQDGAAFHDSLLGPAGIVPRAPKWYKGDTPEVAPGSGDGGKQPGGGGDFPVVPVAAAGGLAVTSVVLYAVAGGAASSMADATTPDELTKKRSTANLLVLFSGVTAAGAVGVGVSGALLDGAAVNPRF